AWYSCQGEKIGQGKQNAIQYLREHPELAQSLEERIKTEMLGSGAGLTTASAEDFAEEEM
ncbi:MAG TPA: DNA recombination/repair protein RecA, partial [Cellvibrionaceae bacterium]|nr:DNA recombination/repair protein RecA [Cellvibrionaceae bacterium]